ncbi:hypothetical protein SAMN05444340_108113 [Citreimonas salinaria]|uniref:Glycosyl transferase family 2 n=2 Tax=Citreimonas salinaria TaxID=321339 RepID=A0A1H3K1I7_9RHOB|nr:hypothetical protein SAMN05444340_108113 [Citreimonas salinaria]
MRRLGIRAAQALGGHSLVEVLEPQPSETAALDLRRARAGRPAPEAAKVVFLIPLVGPAQVGDWDAVTDRLHATLRGLIAQADPRWEAVICCQQRPPLPDDARISHLPFNDPEPGNDKWRKLAALCDELVQRDGPPSYVMSFDADDLPHHDLVGGMLSQAAPGGYLVERGYVMDDATGEVALAAAPDLRAPLRKPFWKLCGSCAALHHDPALPQSGAFLRAMMMHEHRMFPYLARLAGLRLRKLADPVVLYVLNHGENFGARRGRVGYKTRFVRRFSIGHRADLPHLSRDFPLG